MIPPFNPSGLLPPFLGTGPHLGSSPYDTDPLEFTQRFATSPQRIKHLLGFFEYRRQLALLGIVGMQCVDGSFCENIEFTVGRAPGDIDLVTFLQRPPGHTAQPAWDALVAANPNLLTPNGVKAKYGCDAYFVDISFGPEWLISETAYWINLFTHKKVTYDWKGALMMPFPHPDDGASSAHLVTLRIGP